MENKFEAVIDLEAQPFTSALQTAIAGLQALAAELQKANGVLDQVAGGMDKSAAAADTMAGSAAGAAGALTQEAQAAKEAAGAHDRHASAADKSADSIGKNSAKLRDMHTSMMLASNALRAAATLTSGSKNETVSASLAAAGEILNVFAIKSMMGGKAAAAAAMFAAAAPVNRYWDNKMFGEERRQGREAAGDIGQKLFSDQMRDQISDVKSFNDLLSVQKRIKEQIAQAEVALRREQLLNTDRDRDLEIDVLVRKLSVLKEMEKLADSRAVGVAQSEISSLLNQFDKTRQSALGERGFELSLINAKNETDKLSIIETRIKQLRAEGEETAATARTMQGVLSPSEIKTMLDKANELLGKADALDVQKADMAAGKKGSGKDIPSPAYNAPQVDELWKRGMFLGDSIGGSGQTVDYSRRAAIATEKVARNTERLLAHSERGTSTATWGG